MATFGSTNAILPGGGTIDPFHPTGGVTPAPQPTVQPAQPTQTIPAQQPTYTQVPQQQQQPIQQPQITINNAPAPQQNQQQTQQPQVQPPNTSLQTGSQGQDVQNLQNYLVQMGYLTPEQVATGPGIYGPKTTAAVAKMQQDLGIQGANGNYGPQTQQALSQKYQGIFSSLQGTQLPTESGDTRAAIQSATALQNSTSNPVFGAMAASLAPIMQSLGQVLNNINNPALTGVSLQQEYNDMRQQYGLPDMQAQLMNMNRIMNGTEQDIRDEVQKTGGFATESQVQGIAATRNKVILKQYNALATQYDAATQNVNAMMQYAQTDQSMALQRNQLTASITESLATIQNQMMTMGMTMQNNARSAAQYNVTQMGYKGLAESAAGNPQMLSYYENMLALAPGTLSNSATVAAMDTYKDQTLQLNNYKAAIQAYNAGYSPTSSQQPSPAGFGSQYGTATSTVSRLTGIDPNTPLSQVDVKSLVPAMIQNEGGSPKGVLNNPGNIKFVGLPGQINSGVKAKDGGTFASYATPDAGQAAIAANIQSAMSKNPNMTLGAFVDRYTNTAPSQPGQIGITPVDTSSLVRPPYVDTKVPLTMSADQMQQYMSVRKDAQIDPGTNNVIAPGVGYYLQQADGSYVLKSALPSPIENQYQQIRQTIANTQPQQLSPTVTRKWSLTANAALSSFKDMGTYKVISNIAPYLANIRAAAQNPGSVGDLELLDSYVRASKGGSGQVTGDQVDIVLKGSSLGDKASVWEQKLQRGGVLSPQQRNDLIKLSSNVYEENANDYKKIYVQAIQNLQNQGVPTQFWGNLPDLTALMTQQ